ncbi:hypothetical protein ACK3TF_005436 [Chlorella vulgaris]
MRHARNTVPGGLWLVLCVLTFAHGLTTTSQTCAVSQAPQYLSLPTCATSSNRTLDEAQSLGWRFAPVIYTHPMERYHLQSPDVWFNASEVFYQDLKPRNESIFSWHSETMVDELMFMPRSFASLINSTLITEEERADIVGGAPFEDGLSTARLFYSVAPVYDSRGPGRGQPVPGLWMYTYHIFYSWNGCSNQDFALSLNGTRNVVQYLLCPWGVHEGDWEHIVVLVCDGDDSIQQTTYSQHGWWETRDCTQGGQCPTEVDEQGVAHPVSYAGFESHANYYEQAPLIVYAWKNATFKGVSLDNLGGVWVGDRTQKDPTRKFMPTSTNVVRVPSMQEIQEQNLTGWSWAAYPGNWGSPLQKQNSTFYCLDANQTELSPCLDSPAVNALRTGFSLLDTVSQATGGGSFSPSSGKGYEQETYEAQASGNNTWAGPGAITGPLYRTWTYQWLPVRYAPIHDDFARGSVITCPSDAEITLPFPDVSDFRTSTSINTIVQYLVGICVGAVLCSALFILLLAIPGLASKTLRAPHVLIAYGGAAVRKYSKTPSGKLAAAASAPVGETGPASGGGAVDTAAAAGEGHSFSKSQPDAAEYAVTVPEQTNEDRAKFVWVVWAAALWIAAVVLLSLGAAQLVTNSVATLATTLTGSSTATTAMQWLVIGSLLITAACDLASLFMVLLAHKPTIQIWRWRVRNYLYSAWVHRHVFRITVVLAGLMIMVISLACILFGLGLVVITIQLAVRLGCSKLASLNIDSITVSDVCLTIPAISTSPVCGWQAMEVCYDVTNMGVLLLVLGSMFLLWSHLIWMILLLLSIWRYLDWKIVVPEQAGPSANSGSGKSSMTATAGSAGPNTEAEMVPYASRDAPPPAFDHV